MEFQGFLHSYPVYSTLSAAILLIVLSWYSYKKNKHIPSVYRFSLIGLRSLIFLFLLVLLLNPYFIRTSQQDQKSSILFMLDDSESTTLQKGDYSGEKTYRNLLGMIQNDPAFDDIRSELFKFSDKTVPIKDTGGLDLNGSGTNLNQAFSQVLQLEDEADAVVLITDGIITYGKNPLLDVLNLTIPVYTVGLGDTTEVRDIVIQSVNSPLAGYTDSDHPVQVSVSQNGYGGRRVNLQLLDASGSVITESELDFTADRSVTTADLEIPLTEAGLQQFSVHITPIESEWSADNNSTFFSVDVSESKIRVLDIAFEVHPDVRMMRSILASDPNIELTTRTRSFNGFIEGDSLNYGKYDLIVIHGSDSMGNDPEFLRAVAETPTLYLRKPMSYRTTGQPFVLSASRSSDIFQVGFRNAQQYSDHPILEVSEVSFASLPPLFSTLDTKVRVPDARSLLTGTFEDIAGDQSIFSILERGNIRRAELSAWGWFRIFQSPSDSEREYLISLFSNIVNWVSSDPNDNRLRITPRKPVFDPNENVILDASLRNESGEAESGAVIELVIQSKDGSERAYTMDSEGSGSYLLEIDNIAPGNYEYSATARKGGREIATHTGGFLVNKSNAELIYTTRNDELLSALALETGGRYLTYDNAGQLWQLLRNDGLTDSRQVVSENYFYPVRSYWWFVLIILLLGGEWLLRKRFSLP